MNDAVRDTLCNLIAKHGHSLCDDPRQCKALLLDFCGQHRGEITVLIDALEEGVVTNLRSTKSGLSPGIVQGQMVKRLQDHRFLTEAASRWAVESWSLALEIPIDTSTVDIPRVDIPTKEVPNKEIPTTSVASHSPSDSKQQPLTGKDSGTVSSLHPVAVFLSTPAKVSSIPVSGNENSHLSIPNDADRRGFFTSDLDFVPVSRFRLVSTVAIVLSFALTGTMLGMGYALNEFKSESERKAEQFEQKAKQFERLEAAVTNAIGSSSRSFFLNNNCDRDIEFALRYLNSSKAWVISWWKVKANQRSFLTYRKATQPSFRITPQKELIQLNSPIQLQLNSPIFYYYAEIADSDYSWQGEDSFIDNDGRFLAMRLTVGIPDSDDDYQLSLNCENIPNP